MYGGISDFFILSGCLFQTARTYNAANFEDLSEVVRHVKMLNPGIPIAAAGVSMGGYVILYSKFCYVLIGVWYSSNCPDLYSGSTC
jgi:hypothetical protein